MKNALLKFAIFIYFWLQAISDIWNSLLEFSAFFPRMQRLQFSLEPYEWGSSPQLHHAERGLEGRD